MALPEDATTARPKPLFTPKAAAAPDTEPDNSWWSVFLFRSPAATVRRLGPLLLLMLLYNAAFAYVILNHLLPTDDSKWTNIDIMHSLLGFALSILLVFRTNSAYDRWWEGRRQWGALVNNSRNLAIKLDALLPATPTGEFAEDRAFFRAMIPNFAFVLKNFLRGDVKITEWETAPGIPNTDILLDRHRPTFTAQRIFARLDGLRRRDALTELQLLLLNNEFQGLMDVAGACERIRNSPIPTSYTGFIRKFITIFCLTLPFGHVVSLHYWIVPVVTFVFYVLASLEEIAEEIEEPFGLDANDLPTDRISAGIRKVVGEVLRPEAAE